LRVQIAARHCDVPDSVRQRTEEQLTRLAKYDPRVGAAEVIYEEEKRIRKVEVVLSVDRGESIVAHGEGEEFRTALDKAVDRLTRMLKRQRAQTNNHQGPKLSDGVTD
jgi:ribosomal subunit interface protein